MKHDPLEIGPYLRKRREEIGRSLEDLAELLEVPVSELVELESGKCRNMFLHLIAALYLEIELVEPVRPTLDDLMEGTELDHERHRRMQAERRIAQLEGQIEALHEVINRLST